ncbi:MAG: OmpH family outer membrane protein [Rikenellaceae bacterium]|nr:OmpH family outer membrane protein [Rikenellaceae bacterium]
MKKLIIAAALIIATAFTASAQNNVMVLNTETIFKSIQAYNDAMTSLDNLGQQYQQQVDDAFAEVEQMFNEYQNQKAYLSQATRTQREDAIINREKEINAFQEQIFGQDGELLKRRIELIKPIQDKVFQTINSYAESNGYQIVLDISQNPTILYYAPSSDRTQDIISLLN